MHGKTLGILVALSAALSAAMACSSSSTTSTGPKYATVQAFCTAKAEAECVVSDLCVVKKDACIAKRNSVCNDAAKNKNYNSAIAEACLVKVIEVYRPESSVIKPVDLRAVESACDKVYGGTVEQNKACETTGQCSSAFVCDKGFCATPTQKKGGELCGNPGESCEKDYFCVGDGVKSCIRGKLLDEACSQTAPCLTGFRCLGTCKPQLDVTEVCGSDGDCKSGYCEPVKRICTPGLTFGGGSDVCKQYGG